MSKKYQFRNSLRLLGGMVVMAFVAISLYSCGGSATKSAEETKTDDESFYNTQPLHSGLYDADYYDITGTNDRKGHFDGRIYFSLSPETSALYVFENGNRTKIDYIVALQRPFERGDSGRFTSVDLKDNPVVVYTDSTVYSVDFQKGSENFKIFFSPKPRHTGTAVEILEKMNAQKNKK